MEKIGERMPLKSIRIFFVWEVFILIGFSLLFSQETTPYGYNSRPDNSGFQLESLGDTAKKFELIPAFPNVSFPFMMTHLTNADDGSGRIFITDWAGAIWSFFEDSTKSDKILYLDISDRVSDQGKAGGLFCLAFHPDYKSNGKFYVTYTHGQSSSPEYTNRLSEFTVSPVNPWIADPASERILIEFPHPDISHHMNNIAFGPDGFLYVGVGDGGYSNPENKFNAQDYQTILGSIIRIDVNTSTNEKPYGIPNTNPFVGNSQRIQEEIWVKGVRQPWRFTFDSQGGDLWLADVGSGFREEINVVRKGLNYGWPNYEGSEEMLTGIGEYEPPVYEYTRDVGNCAIGGYVYRSPRFPELNGTYLYADYVWKIVYGLVRDQNTQELKSVPIASSSYQITSFGLGETNTVYFSTAMGGVYKLARKNTANVYFPTKLSQSGMFTDINKHQFSSGVIPYSVNSPQYSGGIQKNRYFALPNEKFIYFNNYQNFDYPDQSIFIEEYFVDTIAGDFSSRKYLETRMLIKRKGTPEFDGYSYLWNNDGSDAELNQSIKPVSVSVTDQGQVNTKTHMILNSTSCNQCHQSNAKYILGFNTGQLNKFETYGSVVDNQLRTLNHIDIFKQGPDNLVPMLHHSMLPAQPSPYDENELMEKRVFSYLDVNCKQCHSSGYLANVNMDLSYNLDRYSKNIIGVNVSTSSLGLIEPQRVKYGDPANSALLHRIETQSGVKMPPVPDNGERDSVMLNLLTQWIGELTPVNSNPPLVSNSIHMELNSYFLNKNESNRLNIRLEYPGSAQVQIKLVQLAGTQQRILFKGLITNEKVLQVNQQLMPSRGMYLVIANLPNRTLTQKLLLK